MSDMKPYAGRGRATAEQMRRQAARLRERADDLREQLDATTSSFRASFEAEDSRLTTADRVAKSAGRRNDLGARR